MTIARFFAIDTLGDAGEDGFCFLDTDPEGIDGSTYRLSQGEQFNDEYPSDISNVTWKLGRSSSGLKKPSQLGNTCNILAVHVSVADTIRTFRTGLVEYLGFSLLNHRNRLHSSQYLFINPVGAIDCLHMNLSLFDLRPNGSVSNIDHIVLDKQKLVNPPDLFRIREDPTIYVISERLANAFAEKGFTNIVLQELEVA